MKKKEKPIIEVKKLNFGYSKDNLTLKNVSFSLFKGDLVAVVGPNGAGKSTLVRLLVDLIKDKSDSIKINGKVAYIPQKFNQDFNFPATVNELLNLECCECSLRGKVEKFLDVSNLKSKQFKDLSGGQQQRVLIAVALLSNPDVLILDEPTVGIDSQTQDDFYKLLKELKEEQGLTILFVTHETSMISNYFTKILCVFNGGICLDEASNSHSVLHKAYGCHFHEIQHNHSH